MVTTQPQSRMGCSVQLGGEWTQHEHLSAVSSTNSPLAATLVPLYASQGAAGSVMYNDEPPSSHAGNISFNLAHAKGEGWLHTSRQLSLPQLTHDLCSGVLGFDQHGGFWLQHSAPKFPDSPGECLH